MISWKFQQDGRCRPQDTMAKDLDLFESVRTGSAAGVFRVYDWAEPAVTIGFHQKTFSFHDPSLSLPLLKRPTGGGAVLHNHDITFSMSLGSDGVLPSPIPECSQRISGVFAKAFQDCGLNVRLQGGRHEFAEVCFARPSPVELMLSGSKILGLALLRKGKYLLAQGVIPLHVDEDLSMRVFGDRLKENPKGILDLAPGFSVEAFTEILRSCFFSELGVFLSDGDEDYHQCHDADDGKVKTR